MWIQGHLVFKLFKKPLQLFNYSNMQHYFKKIILMGGKTKLKLCVKFLN